LKSIITEEDAQILESLIDVSSTYIKEDGPDFMLEFIFLDNEYFDNDKITKSYFFEKDDQDFVFDRSELSNISWKLGKNISGTKGMFGTFFSKNLVSEIDSEDVDNYNEILATDYDIADIIKNCVIPSAVELYLGSIQCEKDEE
jgi:nucleosome assembly protein 1-like 1